MFQMEELVSVRAKSPGKIILSGEHAVVYGAPALAMAINRFSHVVVEQQYLNEGMPRPLDIEQSHPHLDIAAQPGSIFIDLVDLHYQKNISLLELASLRSQISDKYAQFLANNLKIEEVLRNPWELALVAVAWFFTDLQTKEVGRACEVGKGGGFGEIGGLSLQLKSDVLLGSGMGSSASIIVSILCALGCLLKAKLDGEECFGLALEIENFQHGRSSGLDILLAQHGGCVLFEKGKNKSEKNNTSKMPKLPMRFVYTGVPQVTTGQCVAYAAKYFANGGCGVLEDFTAVTCAMDRAMQSGDVIEVQRCVKENNRLLQCVGVVPKKICEFISKLESLGMAAKVCGAGAHAGDAAGVLLVVGEGADERMNEYAADCGYSWLPIEEENTGAQVL